VSPIPRITCLIAALMTTALCLAACGGGSTSSSTSGSSSSPSGSSTAASSSTGEKLTIGLLAPASTSDGGYTEQVVNGVESAIKKNPNLELAATLENITDPEKQIQDLGVLGQKYDIVLAASASLNQAVEVVAPKYPDAHFVVLGSFTKKFFENVTSTAAKVGLDAIVIGSVAATRTTTHKLGMISGLELPADTAMYYGMKQGAELVSSQAEVSQTYTGDYNDVGKARQAAEAMVANGVDQILGDLDAGSAGLNQAAGTAPGSKLELYQDYGIDCEVNPNVVGSGVIDWTGITEDALELAAKEELNPGGIYYGLKSGALRFEFCPNKANAQEEALVKKVTSEIVSGKVKPAEGVVEAEPGYATEER
jgi:basic membrane protein A and related proteins